MFTREQIDNLLKKNSAAVERGILRLYSFQTQDEQASSTTKHHNGKGFSGPHARLGTYYAKWIASGKHLTGKHVGKALHICLVHSQQLTDFANGVFND